PGMREIRHAERELAGVGAAVHVLHGDLPAEAQDAALRRGPGPRGVLATNIAETSVTVAGVEAVVDAGLQRQRRFDPSSGLDRLVTVAISRAAADQRAGRAGREAPGRCLRLWTARADATRAERDLPEVHRV